MRAVRENPLQVVGHQEFVMTGRREPLAVIGGPILVTREVTAPRNTRVIVTMVAANADTPALADTVYLGTTTEAAGLAHWFAKTVTL